MMNFLDLSRKTRINLCIGMGIISMILINYAIRRINIGDAFIESIVLVVPIFFFKLAILQYNLDNIAEYEQSDEDIDEDDGMSYIDIMHMVIAFLSFICMNLGCVAYLYTIISPIDEFGRMQIRVQELLLLCFSCTFDFVLYMRYKGKKGKQES